MEMIELGNLVASCTIHHANPSWRRRLFAVEHEDGVLISDRNTSGPHLEKCLVPRNVLKMFLGMLDSAEYSDSIIDAEALLSVFKTYTELVYGMVGNSTRSASLKFRSLQLTISQRSIPQIPQSSPTICGHLVGTGPPEVIHVAQPSCTVTHISPESHGRPTYT
jgi:hypothetical protein